LERERVTVQEAARRLGITESTVRKRVQRGLLGHDKEADGRLYVYLDTQDKRRDQVQDSSYDMLVRRLENENEFLRRELERKDTILLNMTEAMKALNPPAPEDSSEARESPESTGLTGELGELREELHTERDRREMAESTLRKGMDEERRRREEAERERDDLRRELYALREPRESPQTVGEDRREQSPTPMLQAPQMPCSGRGGAGCSGEGDKHGPKNEDHGADRGRVGQEPPTRRRRHHRQRHYIH
jgi:excisionase family DNA binding protein